VDRRKNETKPTAFGVKLAKETTNANHKNMFGASMFTRYPMDHERRIHGDEMERTKSVTRGNIKSVKEFFVV